MRVHNLRTISGCGCCQIFTSARMSFDPEPSFLMTKKPQPQTIVPRNRHPFAMKNRLEHRNPSCQIACRADRPMCSEYHLHMQIECTFHVSKPFWQVVPSSSNHTKVFTVSVGHLKPTYRCHNESIQKACLSAESQQAKSIMRFVLYISVSSRHDRSLSWGLTQLFVHRSFFDS